ncbi:MAG: DUF4426 domain-containing protein [Porticoccaceae bacterium]|nr:DUF4426 domain-containing protein [Porticoccaceae bacterium]
MKNISHFAVKFDATRWLAISTLVSIFVALSPPGNAADESEKSFKDYKVLYSAFNSSFISPEVANTYSIIRGKDRGLVNIAVLPHDAKPGSGGKPALVSGYVKNIIAQQQKLEFFEVNEGSATYYLAPFHFENEDFMTFKIQIQPDPNKPADDISFQRTFYYDK